MGKGIVSFNDLSVARVLVFASYESVRKRGLCQDTLGSSVCSGHIDDNANSLMSNSLMSMVSSCIEGLLQGGGRFGGKK